MSSESLTLGNVVVIKDIPDTFCFESAIDLILKLTQILGVEIPNTITNVIISADQPLDDQTDSLWVRRNNAGTVIGIYVFSDGVWQQRFPCPQEVFWKYSSDGTIPKGYIIADETNTLLPPGVGEQLKNSFIKDATGSFYIYLAVTLNVN